MGRKSKAGHYTPGFLRAWAPIEKQVLRDGCVTEDTKIAFRDAMLNIGHLERIQNLYRVQGKLSREAEFFRPNSPQKSYLKSKKGRDVILKIRQVGFTTLSCVRGYDMALWLPNMRTGIMAHLQVTVDTIFSDIVKFIHESFKTDWGHLYHPTEQSDSAKTLSFLDDGLGRKLHSSMRVLFDFRGKTVPFLHVSEAARVDQDRLLGSLQGVPVNGEVILESTPNGMGGEFYRQWQNHKAMGHLAPYRGHFIPWFEYYPERPQDWVLPEGTELTGKERSLIAEFPQITDSHIAWRRWCIEANCRGDEDVFENEYPSDDINCWFTGENLVFGTSILKMQSKHSRPPGFVGHLVMSGAVPEFQPDDLGLWSLWEKPRPGMEYAAGADPSGGIGRDRGAAVILNRSTGEIVGRLWGQMEPTDFAQELWKGLVFFNKAWVCPEANNHGHVVIHCLKEKNYKNIYKRKTLDQITQKLSTVAGFLTTSDSKLLLTERFKEAAKSGKVLIRDPEVLREMSTFVQSASKSGMGSLRRGATSGSHDDLLIAACLAWEMHTQRGLVRVADEEDDARPDEAGAGFDEDTGLPY